MEQADCHGVTSLLLHARDTCSAEEFEQLVQKALAANAGIDYEGMADFMMWIAKQAMQQLADATADAAPNADDPEHHRPPHDNSNGELLDADCGDGCSDGLGQQHHLWCLFKLQRAGRMLNGIVRSMKAAMEHNMKWTENLYSKQSGWQRWGSNGVVQLQFGSHKESKTGHQQHQSSESRCSSLIDRSAGGGSGAVLLPQWVREADQVIYQINGLLCAANLDPLQIVLT